MQAARCPGAVQQASRVAAADGLLSWGGALNGLQTRSEKGQKSERALLIILGPQAGGRPTLEPRSHLATGSSPAAASGVGAPMTNCCSCS